MWDGRFLGAVDWVRLGFGVRLDAERRHPPIVPYTLWAPK